MAKITKIESHILKDCTHTNLPTYQCTILPNTKWPQSTKPSMMTLSMSMISLSTTSILAKPVDSVPERKTSLRRGQKIMFMVTSMSASP